MTNKQTTLKKKSQSKFPPPLLPFTLLHSNYNLGGHVILQCLYAIINQVAFTTGNEKGREVSIQIQKKPSILIMKAITPNFLKTTLYRTFCSSILLTYILLNRYHKYFA